MGILIISAIVLTFAAMALFARTQGLKDKIPADHDPAVGDPKRDFTLAIVVAVSAAAVCIAALISS